MADSLKADLKHLYKQMAAVVAPDEAERLVAAAERLAARRLGDTACSEGDSLPHFHLEDTAGKMVGLSELLATGPLVLSLYRGSWCEFCKLELRAWQHMMPQIQARGAQLVAISPQLPRYSLAQRENLDLTYPILHDAGNQWARRLGLVFEVEDDVRGFYRSAGFDLTAYNGDHGWYLPVPATYVVSTDGRVAYAYIQSDHCRRAEPATVLDFI